MVMESTDFDTFVTYVPIFHFAKSPLKKMEIGWELGSWNSCPFNNKYDTLLTFRKYTKEMKKDQFTVFDKDEIEQYFSFSLSSSIKSIHWYSMKYYTYLMVTRLQLHCNCNCSVYQHQQHQFTFLKPRLNYLFIHDFNSVSFCRRICRDGGNSITELNLLAQSLVTITTGDEASQ